MKRCVALFSSLSWRFFETAAQAWEGVDGLCQGERAADGADNQLKQ
jgi:hypothetical protein